MFQSELNFHKTIHCKIPTFKCMSKNCDKVYKSANELNKHVLKHSGMVWDCGEKDCDYSTDDRRNLRAHKRKHQNIVSGYHADTPITIKAEPFIWPTAAFINIHEHPL